MPTISFKKPFDLTDVRRQGAVAFATIYTGKLAGSTGPATATIGKGKGGSKKFKKIGEVPYKYLSMMDITDKTKGLDDLRFTFANVLLSDGERLLDLFLEGEYLKIIWGVRGLWHFTRIMQVRTIEPLYGSQINYVLTASGTGARLQDIEDTKTYNGLKISEIAKEIATDAGMRFAIELQSDPVIPHLSSARRSPMELLYQLADKYGFYVRVVNNILMLTEISDGQPVRRYDFSGPRGNILEFKGKSTIAGIRGSTTKVKNREDQSGTSPGSQTGAKETKPSRSLSIQFKDNGKGYKTTVKIKNAARPTKKATGAGTDRTKRTKHSLRRGSLASRVAKGHHVKRVLKTKKASIVLINEPLVPNVNILIAGLNEKYNGRYCTHDIKFTFTGGFWKITADISRASQSRQPGGNKVNKKGAKSPNKRKGQSTANPKITVRYKRNGSYSIKRVGFGVGSRVSSR